MAKIMECDWCGVVIRQLYANTAYITTAAGVERQMHDRSLDNAPQGLSYDLCDGCFSALTRLREEKVRGKGIQAG